MKIFFYVKFAKKVSKRKYSSTSTSKIFMEQSKRFTRITKTSNVTCEKLFTQAGNLRIHIKTIHQGHKDFKCDSCGNSFRRVDQMRLHIKTIHKANRDFKCDSCGKSFSQAAHLRGHIKIIHEVRKDFKCDSSGKSFSQSCNLRTHIKNLIKIFKFSILLLEELHNWS